MELEEPLLLVLCDATNSNDEVFQILGVVLLTALWVERDGELTTLVGDRFGPKSC
jgi:hypothetical protein